jgi:hypothetical protein
VSDKRLVESDMAQISASPSVVFKVDAGGGSMPDSGGNCIEYEFTAMLNGGEQVRAKFTDPHFTMYKNFVNNDYFQYGRDSSMGPVLLESWIRWNSDLRLVTQNHIVVTMAPSGATNSSEIELLAIDYPSYYLAAGDASGKSYKGNVNSVIQQVFQQYNKEDRCTLQFDTKTSDNKQNRWWQLRMDPKTFILSILDWSTSLSEKQTRWMLYPDDDILMIKEQAEVESKQRATYEWRGYGGTGDKRVGDILEWEFIGDNALQMLNQQMVTSGMSSISGAYFDQSTYKQDKSTVYVGDKRTSKKFKPDVEGGGELLKSFLKPSDEADPTLDVAGWTTISSIPELSGGDMGLKYGDYIDGRARGAYLSSSPTLMRMRFRVFGHHIWSGSEGLGADTINITLTATDDGAPYFMAGNWIVYGFSHIYHPGIWTTDLYCYRLDKDAEAKAVGKGT